jgi:hypothetical protein
MDPPKTRKKKGSKKTSSPRKSPRRSSRKSPRRSSSPRKTFCINPEMINDHTIRIIIRVIRDFIIENGFIIKEYIEQNDSTLHTDRHIIRDEEKISTISFNRYKDNMYEIEMLLENTINESKEKLDFFIEDVKRMELEEKDIAVYNIAHVNSSRDIKHLGKIQILLFLFETIIQNGNLNFIIRLDNDTRTDESDTRPSPYTIFGFIPMTDISMGPEEFCLGTHVLPSVINVLEIICKEHTTLCENICREIHGISEKSVRK